MLDGGNPQQAGQDAYKAMLRAAKALVQIQYDDVSNDPEEIVEEFKERFVDTELFFDPFAGPKFAHYFLAAHEDSQRVHTAESALHLIEEAHLFLEAVHSCYNKLRTQGVEKA
jgi:sulfite reductase (ferredoxin)